MTDYRKLTFTNVKTNKENVIEVPKHTAMIIVQSMHLAGVDAWIEFTEDDLIAA